MLEFITDRNIYEKVILERISKARRFLWIATSDLKDLYVEKQGRMVPFLEILSDLVKKHVEIRLLHAKEPGPAFRKDFDKYPNLKVVSTESGVGWIPYMLEAMEYQFDEMMPNEAKSLEKRPSEYFRDNMYACFWFESKSLAHALELLGDRNTLFETDFPHPTCYYPNSRERVAEALANVPDESRRRILQDNAAELYKVAV